MEVQNPKNAIEAILQKKHEKYINADDGIVYIKELTGEIYHSKVADALIYQNFHFLCADYSYEYKSDEYQKLQPTSTKDDVNCRFKTQSLETQSYLSALNSSKNIYTEENQDTHNRYNLFWERKFFIKFCKNLGFDTTKIDAPTAIPKREMSFNEMLEQKYKTFNSNKPQAEIENLKNELKLVQAEIENLENKLLSAETDNQALKTELTELKSKQFESSEYEELKGKSKTAYLHLVGVLTQIILDSPTRSIKNRSDLSVYIEVEYAGYTGTSISSTSAKIRQALALLGLKHLLVNTE